MVPPPKRVDAVEVKNTTSHAIKVKVIYDNHKDQTEMVVEQTVQPGQAHTFGERELDMGGWQAVAPVARVEADGPGGAHVLTPAVSGIVKLLQVSAADSAGRLQLSQH